MINGFVIEIQNTTKQKRLVTLFQNKELPEGITIRARNTEYDYTALLSMAKTKGFVGSGINIDQKLEFTLNNGATTETYVTKLLTDKEIEVDGFLKFIAVDIPSDTNVIFQLMPVF